MKNLFNKFLSIALVVALMVTLFSATALAWVGGAGSGDKTLQVGVSINWEINTHEDAYIPVTISSGTLPNGIVFTHEPPYNRSSYRLSGTALPGTVGAHEVFFADTEGLSRELCFCHPHLR